LKPKLRIGVFLNGYYWWFNYLFLLDLASLFPGIKERLNWLVGTLTNSPRFNFPGLLKEFHSPLGIIPGKIFKFTFGKVPKGFISYHWLGNSFLGWGILFPSITN